MPYAFITGAQLAPYERMTGFIGGPGLYRVLIIVDRPNTNQPILYASIRPRERFDPNVGGVGLQNFYRPYFPMYRTREIRDLTFSNNGFLEVVAQPGPFDFPVRYRIFSEPQ